MFFSNIVKRFLDIVYPPHCTICNRSLENAEFLCSQCILEFKSIDNMTHCNYCFYPFPALDKNQKVHDCFNCRNNGFVFKKNYSLFLFEGKLKELVHKYKFYGQDFLAEAMASYLISFCKRNVYEEFDIITFVPLDKKRHRERGYNQAKLLAQKTAKGLGKCAVKSTLRQIKTKSVQSSLSRKERYNNVKGSFSVANPKLVSGARILLIDDVCTTGATLNECSKVLLAKGAKEVITLSFARAVLD